MTEPSIYAAAGGADALVALAHAWHDRCLADPLAAHPFTHPGQHPLHLDRLAAYWAEALGGPATYTGALGDESHVRRLHAGNGDHPELDQACLDAFAAAVDDVLPDDARLRATVVAYFTWANGAMTAYPDSPDDVPPDLAVPHWSWDGPREGSRVSDDDTGRLRRRNVSGAG